MTQTQRPAMVITIDTEGDNLWGRPRELRCDNARYLPRFQQVCERYGLKPTWLTNHEMVCCPEFVEFARDVLARKSGEVGMHLHAWNSPPIDVSVTDDDFADQPFLIEYPLSCMREKIHRLTDRLEETFEQVMTSHRAGRWALNETYAGFLRERGYLVDCSVTPLVDWKGGRCRVDYRDFPQHPYRMHDTDISRPAESGLLQVPVTIRRQPFLGGMDRLLSRPIRRLVERVYPRVSWLRPDGKNRSAMLWLIEDANASGAACAHFMIHSSELMPGGSPRFSDPRSIETLYEDLEALFEVAAHRCHATTLTEFAEQFDTQ